MATKKKIVPTTHRVTAYPVADFYDTRAGVKRQANRQFLTSKEYAESLGDKVYDVKPWGEGDAQPEEPTKTATPKPGNGK